MKKGYWVVVYHSIKDPAKAAAYRAIVEPTLQAAGGRFVIRGMPSRAFEKGQTERVVIVEFENVDKAIAVHDSPEYRAALDALGDGAERDFRIVEAVD